MGIWASCLLLLLKNSCLTIVILITTTSDVNFVANIVVVSFIVVTKISNIVLLLHVAA